MQVKALNFKMVGFGLAAIYAVSFISYLQTYPVPDFRVHAYILTVFFAVLFVAAVAVAKVKEWGRVTLVFGNLLLGLYLLKLYIDFSDFIPLAYVLMSFLIFLFFANQKVEASFQVNDKKHWRSILIIDDDEALIKMIRPVLISNDFAVLTASSGETGLLVAKNQKPDLIFLDVILPGIKGRDVCRQLKENRTTKNIPVVFLTAKDSPEDIQAEKDVGGEAHLTKPVNANDLIKTIRKILG